MVKIYLGSDHAGFKLKERLKVFLIKKGFICVDVGPHSYDKDDDYPDYIIPAVKKVAKDSRSRGIILGGSGQGEALAANKVRGIRAVVYYGGDIKIVKLSREHNNANVLSLGARFLKEAEAKRAINVWLKTNFSNDKRHVRRLNKIKKI